MSSAVVVGAGAVGLGVVTEQLLLAGHEVTVLTRGPEAAAGLEQRGVVLRYCGATPTERVLRPCAVPVEDPAALAAVGRADLVVVAVQGSTAALAPLLSAGWRGRDRALDVWVCDNSPDPTSELRLALGRHGVAPSLALGLVPVLVDRMARRTSRPAVDWPAVVVAEAAGHLVVDARALRTTPPDLPQAVLVQRQARHVARKLSVFSAGHAAVAYLGRLAGHEVMASAATDPDVARVARLVMQEGRRSLRPGAPDSPSDRAQDARTLERFGDPVLADRVDRVARDPRRKLGRHDRICGPALRAHSAGIATPGLATVAGAAWTHLLAERGEDVAGDGLAELCGLPSGHPFVAAASLAAEGLAAGLRPTHVLDLAADRLAGDGVPA